MSKRSRFVSLAAAGTLAALTLGTPLAAQADVATFDDGADATGSPTDIRAVKVNHSTDRFAVVTHFTDLRKHAAATPSVRINLDTDPMRPGAEYAFVGGLETGTDYALTRVRHGKMVGPPMACDTVGTFNFRGDTVRFGTARKCLGNPEKVRISMKMVDPSDGSRPIHDWLGAPRSWTHWIARSS